MTQYNYLLDIDCSGITPGQCSDKLTKRTGLDFPPKTNNRKDPVNGGMTIVHNFPPLKHEISVHLIDEDNPNPDYHPIKNPTGDRNNPKGIFWASKKPVPFPSEDEIRQRLLTPHPSEGLPIP